MKKILRKFKGALIFNLVIAAALVLSACGGAATPAPTQDVALIQTQAAQTVVADLTQNATAPTQAPPPTAVNTETPPPPDPPDPEYPGGCHPDAGSG
jgi:hypothetical protein